MTSSRDFDLPSHEFARTPEPIRATDGTALTRIVAGGQQRLRCGRFEDETCNGSGLNVMPCRLGRWR